MNLTRRQWLRTAGSLAAAGPFFKARAAAPIPGAQRPNILLLMADQHRHDWTGATPGLGVRTPNLDRLAEMGTRFSRAICPAPLCAPSRSCFATGCHYDGCGVYDNGEDLELDRLTLYKVLRDAGYATGGCGKFDLQKGSNNWGADGRSKTREWGLQEAIDTEGKQAHPLLNRDGSPRGPYAAFLLREGLLATFRQDAKRRAGKQNGQNAMYCNTDPTPLPDFGYNDNWVSRTGLEVFSRLPAGKPWFMHINWPGPHDPEDITRSMEGMVRGRPFPQPHRNTQYPPGKHLAIRQNYTAMVENIDRWVGEYLTLLECRGELERTLVVYTSDHGEMLGDHNRWAKQVPFQSSLSVPLYVAGPGVARGAVCAQAVETLDLVATFIEAAGVAVPAAMDSRSLLPLLTGSGPASRSVLTSGLTHWRLAYDGRHKLIRGFDPDPVGSIAPATPGPAHPDKLVLFDLENDPLENDDVATRFPEIVRRLAAHLPRPVAQPRPRHPRRT